MLCGYSHKPEPKFHSARNETVFAATRFFGVENEISYKDGTSQKIGNNELSDLLDEIGNGFTYCKRDCSISNERGVELVTHPATLAYHMKECHWKHLVRTAQKNGYRSHDASLSCGLHIHVNRDSLGHNGDAQGDTIRKMIVMLDLHRNEVTRFTRRSSRALDEWASIPHAPSFRGNIRTCGGSHNSRYTALNVTNSATVEFRIFRGTLRRDTIIAAIQFCNNWCDYAMTHTWDEVENSTFVEIMKTHEYNELSQYLVQRGLLAPDVPVLTPNARVCDFSERAS